MNRSVALKILDKTLTSMSDSPKGLDRRLAQTSENEDLSPAFGEADLLTTMLSEQADGAFRDRLHQQLARWDIEEHAPWISETTRGSQGRRHLIYSLLQVSAAFERFCEDQLPYYPSVGAPIGVASTVAESSSDWYDAHVAAQEGLYWPRYVDHLAKRRGWTPKNLASLEESSRRIVRYLANPHSLKPVTRKGLVVGYVQSGKTANFAGVIARSVDAGYKLVVVLAGTLNVLRDQTQRRLDKDLLGQENLRLDEAYRDDPEFDSFNQIGSAVALPGKSWIRLTSARTDYDPSPQASQLLQFGMVGGESESQRRAALSSIEPRLAVVKKHPRPLRGLIDALNALGEGLVDWSSIPALIIDDESDQASVNTSRSPVDPEEHRNRTEINRLIVELLKALPRAQYIGYTATPFANVFIDPSDSEDLFPSDFIFSLPRPNGYMGVREFQDEPDVDPKSSVSNQWAFVRDVIGEDEELKNLPSAIDAFVLSGAVKLFREARHQKLKYRHHTMLVHNSPRVAAHSEQRLLVERLFDEAGYLTSAAGAKRLKDLWESDFLPVSRARAGELPVPGTFEELRPFIQAAVARMRAQPTVVVVNGEVDEESPNFEKESVWRIIVGGTKLSRGYTVEGLTVSYYRRRAAAADTLMQMGRWFGYREGYQDLVRLFISRREGSGRRTVDLYETFNALCRDEELFREELALYSDDSREPRITPMQVPPLVPSDIRALLRPTAANKMFNARIVEENFGGKNVQPTVAPVEAADRIANEALVRAALRPSRFVELSLSVGSALIPALVADAEHQQVSEILSGYRWHAGEPGDAYRRFLLFLEGEYGPHGITGWRIVAPIAQRSDINLDWELNGHRLLVRERARVSEGTRYKVYSEGNHVRLAEFLVGRHPSLEANPTTRRLVDPRVGVVLLYPVLSIPEMNDRVWPPTIGFSVTVPANSWRTKARFGVVDETRRGDAIVQIR